MECTETSPPLDYLLKQWQPQSEMLDSDQYHAMMTDPVKYLLYQDAIYHAMVDQRIVKLSRPGVAGWMNMTVCVAGAGFGKLVDMTIAAAERENGATSVKIIIIEHNPVAIVQLHTLRGTRWANHSIEIHQGDMRLVAEQMPASVDIFVSELLGGFGDNELAPECLAGSKIMLRPDGVMIPQSTVSYIAPVAFTNYRHAQQIKNDRANAMWVIDRNAAEFDIPFLPTLNSPTRLKKKFTLLAIPKQVFTFNYPEQQIRHGGFVAARVAMVEFTKSNSVSTTTTRAHGLAGFFECNLYKNIWFGSVPGRATPNLREWLPVFFPTQHPFSLPASVMMRRAADFDTNSVFYEWAVIDGATNNLVSENSTRNTRHAMRLLAFV